MWIRFIIIAIMFLAFNQQVYANFEPPAEENKVSQSHEGKFNREGQQSNEAVTYPPNSHIREEDIQAAIENLVEQETPIGEKSRIEREKRNLEAQEKVAKYSAPTF